MAGGALVGGRPRAPVGDQPLLWKELYIERVQAFGRWLKVLTFLIAAGFLGTSTTWPGSSRGERGSSRTPRRRCRPRTLAGIMDASWILGLADSAGAGLAGLRNDCSERQRGTWDSLLHQPARWPRNRARQNLRRPVCDCAVCRRLGPRLDRRPGASGALDPYEYAKFVSDALVVGAFTVVLGTGFSLWSQNRTRAMTLTIVGSAPNRCVCDGSAGRHLNVDVVLGSVFRLVGLDRDDFSSNDRIADRRTAGHRLVGNQLPPHSAAALSWAGRGCGWRSTCERTSTASRAARR